MEEPSYTEKPKESYYNPEEESLPVPIENSEQLQQEQNTNTRKKMVFFLISLCCWLLFLITGWISFHWIRKYRVVYSIRRIDSDYYYYPLEMTSGMIFFLIVLIMILATLSFLIYIYKSFVIKDQSFLNLMLGYFPRFHFVPLFLNSVLFIIGESGNGEGVSNHRQQIAGLIFILLTLPCQCFIYFFTHFQFKEYLGVFIKKAFYSALIAFNLYYLFYVISQLAMFDHPFNINMAKSLGASFEVILGLIALAISFFFKDAVFAGMYFLIYIGILVYHYKMPELYRELTKIGGADVVICIIMMILFIADIILLGIKYNTELLEA